MRMIKMGMWIAMPKKKGVYAVEAIEDNYVVLKDVLIDKRGNIKYGKKRIIGVGDLDSYEMV